MASYHFSVSVASRADGRSSAAAAAYRAGDRLTCERDGLTHDYRRKRGVLHAEISLPERAPERWLDRSTLWNEVEATERGDTAQLFRETTFAVPHELPRERQVEFCREVVRDLYVSEGMVCDWAIHDADADGHNVHCHVMCPMRSCDGSGFLPKSVNVYTVRAGGGDERQATAAEFSDLAARGYEKVYRYRDGRELTKSQALASGLDPVKDRRGKAPVQTTRYLNGWNDRGNVERWRARFAELQNAALERAGSDARVDHRSYERQGVERIAQRHEGPRVRAVERRARAAARAARRPYEPVTDRAAENAAARERNALLDAADAALAAMARHLEAVMAALVGGREAAGMRRMLDRERREWVERAAAAAGCAPPPSPARQRDLARELDGQRARAEMEKEFLRERSDGLIAYYERRAKAGRGRGGAVARQAGAEAAQEAARRAPEQERGEGTDRGEWR